MDKAQKITVAVFAALICLALVALIIVAVWRGNNTQGSFEAPEFDPSAVSGTPESVDENSRYNSLNLGDAYTVSMCSILTLNNGSVDLYFTSPEVNTVWLSASIYDKQGNLLGETGLIKPGEYVKSVKLSTPPTASTEVVLKIRSYEPETYYSRGTASGIVYINVPQ